MRGIVISPLLKTRFEVPFGSFSVESGNIFAYCQALRALK
jgi:hypothetical protein